MIFDDSLEEYLTKLRLRGNDGTPILVLFGDFTEWSAKVESNRKNIAITERDKQLLEAAFIAGWCARDRRNVD